MPVICTRNRNPSYQPITQRIPQKRQEQSKLPDAETLKTFSVRPSETSSLSSTTSKFLVGTSLPNSIAKEKLLRRESETTQQSSKGWKEDYEKLYAQSLDTGKERTAATKKEKRVSIKPEDQSILSISPKLQELQQLHNQLTKSSYVPVHTTKVFQPRRPTLESIRLAIERAKQETNKNMGTEETSAGISLNDAATLTEKKKTIKKTKKQPGSANQSTGSSRASGSSTKEKEATATKKKVGNDTLQVRMKMKATVKK